MNTWSVELIMDDGSKRKFTPENHRGVELIVLPNLLRSSVVKINIDMPETPSE